MTPRKKKPNEPSTPQPMVTAPDWLADARDHVNALKGKTKRLRDKADLFRQGKIKIDEFEVIERELVEDIDFHATDAYLALDRAIHHADLTESIKGDILDVLREAYNRVRRLSVSA